ncbi:hypothetical protein EV378_5937 [Pseudonocardia endophytica]|uniref:Uncharacterized protein n=2 Tax=Pseudonocardia endophytica TaxID=401976 RepID=A0A4R1HNJ3_PSEEN|nr:hypothetical protein EV378_5937 [Pseudonocardia endophytica]
MESAQPRWIARTLQLNAGQDPLGLQSMTQDRLMPSLLPGILELSDTARYMSFHAFLLDEYARRKLPATTANLSTFVKRCEWDLGLAVQRCPRRCGSSPVGLTRLRQATMDDGEIGRGESVQSPLGGYGLYYRSPMATLGLVARAGTELGDRPTTVDVLRTDSARARRLAEGFRSAVADTAYVQHHLGTEVPLPQAVVEEYAEHACLCRLDTRPGERQAIHDALFTDDDGAPQPAGELDQRRRSVAHFLTLLRSEPDVARTESAYRRAAAGASGERGAEHRWVAGQWAAVMAKDVWQEALCSLWTDFCRRGLARSRTDGLGLDAGTVRGLVPELLAGPPLVDPAMPASELAADPPPLPVADDRPVAVADADLEDLRQATRRLDSAASGLVVILELAGRVTARTGPGWTEVLESDSAWQRPVDTALTGVRRLVDEGATADELLWWLLSRFVIERHEVIAYSKLPDFTFRFRWEEGLLRFVDHGRGRFPTASVRHSPLRRLTRDLGLWEDGDVPRLTARGAALVDEVLT